MKKKIAALILGGGIVTGGTFAADERIDPYLEKQDRFEIAQESILQDAGEFKVELMKDEPKVVFSKWNGEIAMGVKYTKIQAEGNRQFLTDRVEWKGSKEEVHAYPLEAKAGMEDGGFEIEVFLKEKPDTNKFDFAIDGAENLDFFYQPELTPEEISEGASRSENVIGSYAVYHKTKANHRVGSTNYATGKAYHIYRPKAIDNNGVEVWAELNYDNGVLTVTVPQKFLDEAVYPVRVDPTFGNTTIGGTSGNLALGVARGGENSYSPASNGTTDSVSVYLEDDGAGADYSVKGAVYDTGGNRASYHDTNSVTETGTSPDWRTIIMDGGSVLSATSYYPMAKTSANATWYWDALGGTAKSFTNAYTTGWPSTTLFTDGSDRNYSIYATYTASGSTPPPAPTTINGGATINGGTTIQ